MLLYNMYIVYYNMELWPYKAKHMDYSTLGHVPCQETLQLKKKIDKSIFDYIEL